MSVALLSQSRIQDKQEIVQNGEEAHQPAPLKAVQSELLISLP